MPIEPGRGSVTGVRVERANVLLRFDDEAVLVLLGELRVDPHGQYVSAVLDLSFRTVQKFATIRVTSEVIGRNPGLQGRE